MQDLLITITVGGFGTRLWPLSRESYPKQFLDLTNSGISMFQQTLLRVNKINGAKILIIGNYSNRFIILEQIQQTMKQNNDLKNIENIEFIFEPFGKNTMPVAIISTLVAEKYNLKNIILMPSDHLISNEDLFVQYIHNANNFLKSNDGIVTFGINPTFAHTGYGYIKKYQDVDNKNEICKVEKFTEKPDIKTAQNYIESGNYLWNSGIFIYNAKFLLQEAKKFDEDLYRKTILSYENMEIKHTFSVLNEKAFASIKANSIDYVLLENTNFAFVMNSENIGWSDLGNFNEIYSINQKDGNKNYIIGDNVHATNLKSSHVINQSNQLIVIDDISDLLIIATKDVIMIKQKNNNENIKNIVQNLKEQNISEATQQSFDHRPWGSYENILEKDNFKIKHITVNPKQELSYQSHNNRSEHWVIISGEAEIILNDKIIILKKDESIYIPKNTKHKIKNLSLVNNLMFIEIQCGNYFGEDDIIRYEDIYGRT